MIINITDAKNQPSVAFPSSQSLIKSRPLIGHANSSSSSFCSGRLGELAGGTTAECAAICCCCPCGLVNLLVLTMYKVPVGIFRRAFRRKRRKKLIKKGLLPPQTKSCSCVYDDTELQIHPMACVEDSSREFDEEAGLKEEETMVKLEKEMWETFYGAGFWRSPSQRELPFMRSFDSPREAPKARI
ncbi:hypothetical protein SADUNF_Sadunf06G0156700 [Salix dunnii]|uniref:Pollen preferential protein n=1 Tax=Salix dunnii TaxID=1413687 RepID=A0A835K7H1_9ROSI|nr:hypothetical protein SADUNF_Sadunf06G0156700 [Salix dunnii]